MLSTKILTDRITRCLTAFAGQSENGTTMGTENKAVRGLVCQGLNMGTEDGD